MPESYPYRLREQMERMPRPRLDTRESAGDAATMDEYCYGTVKLPYLCACYCGTDISAHYPCYRYFRHERSGFVRG